MDYLIALLAEVPFLVMLTHYLIIYDFISIYESCRVCARDFFALIYFSVSHFDLTFLYQEPFLIFFILEVYHGGLTNLYVFRACLQIIFRKTGHIFYTQVMTKLSTGPGSKIAAFYFCDLFLLTMNCNYKSKTSYCD